MVRSPSASRSATPRSERPISRWISTVRPSGRPLEMSRCLRSPVDAGSIPYSAVIQPRPWPASHRGTDSWTEAVQITRVPPQAISADPGARVAEAAAAQHVLDLAGHGHARADDLHAAPEQPLEHRPDQRIVGAAEDHRVHLRLAQRPRVV